eukprot:gnl/TRDRNA2_/TRDRNA2_74005_c0_seq1.p1 gnl/TRDRNA2_/TRDRNA2_74005_c0~~gnl/TRDRNA2_/TRDRNA2_74005_c0_seq1.p1  ORF type:complete len:407 (+),score=58.35 gnl/TRDRNA2_/TRDRNA2_74005_c0_seq1:64-1284(+)
MRPLELLRVCPRGPLDALSGHLAALLTGKRPQSEHVSRRGLLEGATVLFPAYPCGPMPRWSAEPDAHLSLVCLLATWRVGGVAAPVTPGLLRPPPDPRGLVPGRNYIEELPDVLQQWQPGIVLTFGELEELLSRTLSPRGLWPLRTVPHLRLAIGQRAPRPDSAKSGAHQDLGLPTPSFEVDPSAVAVELPGGEKLTFEVLLAALEDSAAPPSTSSVEGAVLQLLRAARSKSTGRYAGSKLQNFGSGQPWWAGDVGAPPWWPPRRLPRREPSEWTEVQDPYSKDVYYWNRATNETTWEVPAGARRSSQRTSARVADLAASLSARPRRTSTGRSRRSAAPAPGSPPPAAPRGGARLRPATVGDEAGRRSAAAVVALRLRRREPPAYKLTLKRGSRVTVPVEEEPDLI